MSVLASLARRIREREILDRAKDHVKTVVDRAKKPNRAARREYERRVRAMVTRAPIVGGR